MPQYAVGGGGRQGVTVSNNYEILSAPLREYQYLIDVRLDRFPTNLQACP